MLGDVRRAKETLEGAEAAWTNAAAVRRGYSSVQDPPRKRASGACAGLLLLGGTHYGTLE